MNRILVAIDFSDCSINALEHALTIADRANADVKLIWINKADSLKDIFETVPKNINEAIGKKFDELINKYQAGLEKCNIEYEIRKGKVYKEVVNAAEEWNADLIISGTHGASGFEEFWMGSNAYKMVSATKLPTITIRGGVDIDRTLKRIVLPIDSSVETRQKVPTTIKLAKLFDAEVFVLALYTTSVAEVRLKVDQYAQQAFRYIEKEKITCFLEKMETDNLTRTIIDYALNIDANIISVMKEQERATKNLWMGTYASQLVNHSPIPILSVHYESTDY